eukprot:2098462-Pyramimonas_sp.AAC.1
MCAMQCDAMSNCAVAMQRECYTAPWNAVTIRFPDDWRRRSGDGAATGQRWRPHGRHTVDAAPFLRPEVRI